MRIIRDSAGYSMAAGLPAEAGVALVRAFAAAWVMAIVAVFVLPAIFVFGIAAGIVGWMARRNSRGPVIIEGDYRVLGSSPGTTA